MVSRKKKVEEVVVKPKRVYRRKAKVEDEPKKALKGGKVKRKPSAWALHCKKAWHSYGKKEFNSFAEMLKSNKLKATYKK
jgi:hypothetical protein